MDKTITVAVKWKEKHLSMVSSQQDEEYHAHDEKNRCNIDTVRIMETHGAVPRMEMINIIERAK